MPLPDHYKVLKVSSDADVDTIQRAFKDLSLKMHPDKANASTKPKDRVETEKEQEAREKRNHERFVKLLEARDTLVDPKKRKEYDERCGEEQSSSYSNAGSYFSGHGRNRRNRSRRGSDHDGYDDDDHDEYDTDDHDGHGEGRNPSGGRSRRQGTTQPPMDYHAILRRLDRLAVSLDRFGAKFRRRAPSRSSSSYTGYLSTLALIDHIISENRSVEDRVIQKRRFRRHDREGRVAYEAAIERASTYIPLARGVVSDLDEAFRESRDYHVLCWNIQAVFQRYTENM